MKSSNNGMVDPVSKTVRLPSYLDRLHPRRDLLRMAAAAALPMVLWSMAPSTAHAQVGVPIPETTLTLTSTDGYSVSTINPLTSAGMNSLTINGTQQIANQWYYYRESTGPGSFSPINNLGPPTQSYVEQDNSNAPTGTYDIGDVKYASTTVGGVPFTVNLNYDLTGGGPTGVLLTEVVTIANLSATTALPFDIIEYNHFTLDNDSNNETVQLKPPTGSDEAVQSDTQGASITEDATVTSNSNNPPDFHEAALFPGNANLDFLKATFTDLNDATLAGSPTPGDVLWDFEWDGTDGTGFIPANKDLIISKNIAITVPEPATAGLALGGASLFAIRRPRRRGNVA
jgi:hypothetical protein